MSPRARHGRLPGDRTMHRSAQSKFNRTAGRPEARSRFTNCFSPILTRRQRSRLKPPEPVNGRSLRVSPSAALPAMVSFLNPEPALSRGGGNRASCPKGDLRPGPRIYVSRRVSHSIERRLSCLTTKTAAETAQPRRVPLPRPRCCNSRCGFSGRQM